MSLPRVPILVKPATVYQVDGKGRRFLTRGGAERRRALAWMFLVRPCDCETGTVDHETGYYPPVCSIHAEWGTARGRERLARVVRYFRRREVRP